MTEQGRIGTKDRTVTLEKLGIGNWKEYYRIDITEEQHRYVRMRKTRLIGRTLSSLGRGRIWLIRRGSEVCGYIGMWISPKIDQFTIAPFIIDQNHQRQGIGRAALRLACSKMSEAGATRVRLAVHPENRAAISLYEQEGFRFNGDSWGETDRVMALPVNKGEARISGSGLQK